MIQRVAIVLAAGISSRMNQKSVLGTPPQSQEGCLSAGVPAKGRPPWDKRTYGDFSVPPKAGPLSSVPCPLSPKVLHEVCGRPVLAYVLDACRAVKVEKIYVVVGCGAEQIQERFSGADDIVWVHQAEQKGTAHAVLCCKEHLKDFNGETLILCGDGPLIRPETLEALIGKHNGKTAATLATAILDEPAGYGRIIRGADGNIHSIVEHKDCTDEQLKIKEVNPSYYLFNNKILFEALAKVRPDNIQKEYYLTDVFSVMLESGHKIAAVTAVRPDEAMSINTREQLSKVNEIMRKRLEQKA